MKKTIIITLALLLTSCGSTPAETPPPVDVNALYTQAAETIVAGMVEAPIEATQAPPTAEPPAPAPASDNHFAWNYLAEQNSGGLIVEISRILIAEKSAIPDQDFSLFTSFDDKPVVGLINFTVTNTTDAIINVYPDQGKVIIGSEQINLIDYMFATFGDDFSGEIYPGVTAIGGIWFGVKRTPLSEIQSILIAFDAPHDNNFSKIGEEFNFNIDLSNRMDEPLPDELK